MHLFVYYKFVPHEFPGLEGEIRALQKEIVQTFPNVKTGLLRRPAPNDKGQQTWMETYSLEADELELFEHELQRLVQRYTIPQARANEVFIDL